jgi:hypothetical protein
MQIHFKELVHPDSTRKYMGGVKQKGYDAPILSGIGRLTETNGDILLGEFRDDFLTKGVKISKKDNLIFNGVFHNDQYKFGTLDDYKNGRTYSGPFENNKPVYGSMRDPFFDRPNPTLLLFDFDLTLIKGHSQGQPFTKLEEGEFQISHANLTLMNQNMKKWLKAGHKVVILTRCIDTEIDKFFFYYFYAGLIEFNTILGMDYIKGVPGAQDNMPDFLGCVNIVAPNKTVYESHNNEDFWTKWKAQRATELVAKYPGHRTLFLDDTLLNVEEMQIQVPSIWSKVVPAGNYEMTYKIANDTLENPFFSGQCDEILDRLKTKEINQRTNKTIRELAREIAKVQYKVNKCRNAQGQWNWNTGPREDPYLAERSDGSIYTGDVNYWRDQNLFIMHGQGMLIYPNNLVFEGRFENNQFVEGKCYHINRRAAMFGAVYEGEFKNGKEDGKGTETYRHGNVYSGTFKNGVYEGEGTEKIQNGATYSGEFKNGVYEGEGTFTYINGDTYKGSFKGGKRNGHGTYTYIEDNVKIEGTWLNNETIGKRKLTFPDGSERIGNWINKKLDDKPLWQLIHEWRVKTNNPEPKYPDQAKLDFHLQFQTQRIEFTQALEKEEKEFDEKLDEYRFKLDAEADFRRKHPLDVRLLYNRRYFGDALGAGLYEGPDPPVGQFYTFYPKVSKELDFKIDGVPEKFYQHDYFEGSRIKQGSTSRAKKQGCTSRAKKQGSRVNPKRKTVGKNRMQK